MKSYNIIKAVLYVAAAILIFVFQEQIMPYVGYLVGGVIFVYSADELFLAIVKRNLFRDGELFAILSQTLIGVLLFFSSNYIERVCIIWGVWSILREAKELSHAIGNLIKKRPGLLNSIESVTVITLSFFMILTPTAHHAHVHLVLLGVELICVVAFTLSEELFDIFMKKRAEKKAASAEQEEETVVCEDAA